MNAARASSQADFAAALLDPALACPEGLFAWNGSDPSARLAVYRNNVVNSLIDALADSFPVLQELVGVEFFRAMASVFVRQAPPRSQVLADYGQHFPAFTAQFAPARDVPYLADMARLERARVQAYHAADAEPVSSEVVGMALACGDRIGELSLVLHPSVFVVRSAFSIVSLWAAHQGDDDLASIDVDQAQTAIVLRAGLDVLVLNAPSGSGEFMAALLEGACLGDAGGRAATAAADFDLSAILSILMNHGALISLALPGKDFS